MHYAQGASGSSIGMWSEMWRGREEQKRGQLKGVGQNEKKIIMKKLNFGAEADKVLSLCSSGDRGRNMG